MVLNKQEQLFAGSVLLKVKWGLCMYVCACVCVWGGGGGGVSRIFSGIVIVLRS